MYTENIQMCVCERYIFYNMICPWIDMTNIEKYYFNNIMNNIECVFPLFIYLQFLVMYLPLTTSGRAHITTKEENNQ